MTDPAFGFSPPEGLDGGLLARWHFTQTAEDALALLRLRREWPDRAKLAFGLACLAGGALAGVLAPEGWLFPVFLAVEAALIALIFLGRDLMRRRRARRMVPVPRPAVLEEWVDCIAGSEITTGEEDYLSPELIGEVLLTPSHLFIRNFASAIVVPRQAFADAAEAEAFAAHLRALARGPYYFDPPEAPEATQAR